MVMNAICFRKQRSQAFVWWVRRPHTTIAAVFGVIFGKNKISPNVLEKIEMKSWEIRTLGAMSEVIVCVMVVNAIDFRKQRP